MEGPIDHRSADDPDAIPLVDGMTEAVESSDSSDQVASDVGKPRRGRGRGRRLAKSADSAGSSASAAATWIRVGPGKFVRADAHALASSGFDPAESQGLATGIVRDADGPEATASSMTEPGPTDSPETDDPLSLEPVAEHGLVSGVPETDALAETAPVMAVPPTGHEETGSPEQLAEETSHETAEPGDFWADAGCLPVVTEEYGIAPSAFGTEREDASWDVDCDQTDDEDEAGVAAENDPAEGFDSLECVSTDARSTAESSAELPSVSGFGTAQGRVSVSHSGVSRWTVNAVSSVSVASQRRGVRGGGRPNHRIRVARDTDQTFRRTARRAYGRVEQIRRTWRPRSPPNGT
jgi:hypothetical protein